MSTLILSINTGGALATIVDIATQITNLNNQMSTLILSINTGGALATIVDIATQITNLSNQMSAPILSINTSDAIRAIMEVQALIQSIPDITYKNIVFHILGEGSEVKPISEKINDINNAFGLIGSLIPSVTADFSNVTGGINYVSGNISALSDIHPSITADFSSIYSNISRARDEIAQLGSGLYFQDLSFSDLQFSYLPQFAAGTPYVEKDMVARIHKGEAIVPEKYNIFKDNALQKQDTNNNKSSNNYHIYMGDIKIITTPSDTPDALAKKLVKPIRDELRKLAQLQ